MFWNKFRGIFMLGLGCLTSPCCTPFVVPLVLALRVGWVYGALTLVSILRFVLAIRWMQPPKRRQNENKKIVLYTERSTIATPAEIPICCSGCSGRFGDRVSHWRSRGVRSQSN
jgi:hypothetical protein